MKSVPDINVYRGDLTFYIQIPDGMFVDTGDNLTYSTSLWVEQNSQKVITSFNTNLNSVVINVPSDFVGVWTFAIIATDSIGQIALYLTRITINPWYEANWNNWDGPSKSQWKGCVESFVLNTASGSWVFLANFNNLSGWLIHGVVIVIFTLLINFSFSIWINQYPPRLSVLSLHVFLFLLMMTANGWYKSELDIHLQDDYYNFLNGFQFATLSFRDFDKIIFIRPYLVSWLGSSEFWSVYNLHYDSGSVLANYLNFFILIGIFSLFRLVSYLLKRRSRNSK